MRTCSATTSTSASRSGGHGTSPAEPFRLALTRYAGMGFPLHLAFGANGKAMARGLRLVAE